MNHVNLSSLMKAASTASRCGVPLRGLNGETVHDAGNFLYGGQGEHKSFPSIRD